MKKVIVLITVCIFSLNAMAQDNQKMQKQDQRTVKYCAKLKDGKITMMQDKNELTADVNLANGTTIKTDGTVITSDGSQTILRNGECVDNSGNMINPKSGDKMQKQDDKVPPK
jgi:hypothetical protein